MTGGVVVRNDTTGAQERIHTCSPDVFSGCSFNGPVRFVAGHRGHAQGVPLGAQDMWFHFAVTGRWACASVCAGLFSTSIELVEPWWLWPEGHFKVPYDDSKVSECHASAPSAVHAFRDLCSWSDRTCRIV